MALTDKINAYLEQNNISVSPGDYQIGQPEGGVDQILHWDGMRLGPEPTQSQLDLAWATKVSQNNTINQSLSNLQSVKQIAGLNDKIVVYLKQNNIPVVAGDFQTGQPDGEHDQILYWNAMRLGPQPTTDQLLSAWNAKIAQDTANKYIANRQLAYPNIEEQLDMIWHAIDSGTLDKNSDFYKNLSLVKSQFQKL
jgi:hypothetical protein